MHQTSLNPGVPVALAFSALIALGAPLVIAFVFRRGTGASFKYFAIGAAIFFVSQIVLRIPWQVPLAKYVQANAATDSAVSYAFFAFSALTAGLFEETGRWFGYRFFLKQERSWRVGVMYGLGHGGIESILLVGINMTVLFVLYMAFARGVQLPLSGPKLDAVVAVISALTPTQALAGGIERLFALCVQVALSVVVLQAFMRNQRRWLAYAIAMHFIVDFVAVVAAKRAGTLVAEGIVGGFAAVGLVLIFRLRHSEQVAPGAPAGPAALAAPN